MKRFKSFLYIVFLLANATIALAQTTFVGFDSTFVVSPPDSVTQGDTASFKFRIKNYGSIATDTSLGIYSGVFSLGAVSNITLQTTFPSIAVSLLPGDTLSSKVITLYSANTFPVGIDVVVIWPKANNAIPLDSMYYSVFVSPGSNAVAEVLQDYGFKVFPNPFTNSLSIQSGNRVDRVNIYSEKGELLLTKSIAETIDLSFLKPAIYFVELRYTSGSRKRIKVIKLNSTESN